MNLLDRCLAFVDFYTPLENWFFLRFHCEYLCTDEFGSKNYVAPYFNADISRVVIIICSSDKTYLIQYFDWSDNLHPFYYEYLSFKDSLILFEPSYCDYLHRDQPLKILALHISLLFEDIFCRTHR